MFYIHNTDNVTYRFKNVNMLSACLFFLDHPCFVPVLVKKKVIVLTKLTLVALDKCMPQYVALPLFIDMFDIYHSFLQCFMTK